MEYLSWGLSQPVVGATPNIRRVRLGLGGNVQGTKGRVDPSTSIAMAWQGDEGTDASEVEWGTGSDPTQWPPANRVSGITWDTPPGTLNANGNEHMHEVYICGLTPRPPTPTASAVGPPVASSGAPRVQLHHHPRGGNASSVTLGITGDSRGEQNNAWQLTQERMLKIGPTMMLFSGDVTQPGPRPGRVGGRARQRRRPRSTTTRRPT